MSKLFHDLLINGQTPLLPMLTSYSPLPHRDHPQQERLREGKSAGIVTSYGIHNEDLHLQSGIGLAEDPPLLSVGIPPHGPPTLEDIISIRDHRVTESELPTDVLNHQSSLHLTPLAKRQGIRPR